MLGRASSVLLIEDDSADREIFLRVAQECGFPAKVYTVSNEQEAFDYLSRITGCGQPQSAAPPDLILLDLNLPGVSGFEILKRLKRDSAVSGIPVIVLSTSRSADDINRSYALGASSYVVKPSSPRRFFEIMQVIDRYWLQTVSLPVLRA